MFLVAIWGVLASRSVLAALSLSGELGSSPAKAKTETKLKIRAAMTEAINILLVFFIGMSPILFLAIL